MIKALSSFTIVIAVLLGSSISFAFEEITSIGCSKQTDVNSSEEVLFYVRTNIMLDLGGMNPWPINNVGNDMTFENSIWKEGIGQDRPNDVFLTGHLKLIKERNETWTFEGTETNLQNQIQPIEIVARLVRFNNGQGEPDYVNLVKNNNRTGQSVSYENCSLGLTH